VGKDHRTFFDALGRATKAVANDTSVVSANTPNRVWLKR
jgi:hypothetical protein